MDLLKREPTFFLNHADENGDTSLHYAIRNGYTELGQELIRMGLNPNVRNNKNRTALVEAIERVINVYGSTD
jgi:ankyrin repeat protein